MYMLFPSLYTYVRAYLCTLCICTYESLPVHGHPLPCMHPLQTSIRVEREQLLPPLTSSSTSSQSHLSEESCRTPSPDPIPQNDSNVTHSTTIRISNNNKISSISPELPVVVLNNLTLPPTTMYVALVQQIKELTDCIGKVSAGIVVLETQLQINERKGESEHKDDGHT